MELTSKQRAQLRGLASALDTIIHIGKDGISDNLVKQADDALDGEALPGNLQRVGKDMTWLMRQLPSRGSHTPAEVLLAMADGNRLTVFPMESKKKPADLTDK